MCRLPCSDVSPHRVLYCRTQHACRIGLGLAKSVPLLCARDVALTDKECTYLPNMTDFDIIKAALLPFGALDSFYMFLAFLMVCYGLFVAPLSTRSAELATM